MLKRRVAYTLYKFSKDGAEQVSDEIRFTVTGENERDLDDAMEIVLQDVASEWNSKDIYADDIRWTESEDVK